MLKLVQTQVTIVPKQIELSKLTHEASVRFLEVPNIEKFFQDLGPGKAFILGDTFHYVMDDGVFSAYPYFAEPEAGVHYSKRVGFDGTEDAVKRFLVAVATTCRSQQIYNDQNILIGPHESVVIKE